MPTQSKVFGITVDTQKKRRRLVVAGYAALLVVCGGATWLGDASSIVMWTIYSVMALNAFAFGGYSSFRRNGLVKPFANRPPREQSVQSELVHLQIERLTHLPVSTRADDEAWKNDERELGRRDAAHFRAYGVLSIAVMFIFLIATWSLHRPHWVPAGLLPVLLYALALPAMLLAITLPQAIILWTEPDVEEIELVEPIVTPAARIATL